MKKSFFDTYFADIIRHHYADFNGKTGVKEFWFFTLCSYAILLAVYLLYLLGNPVAGAVICLLIALALFMPSLGVAVRRLHDIGKSGWWILISLIPLVGTIWLLVLFCRKGESIAPESKWSGSDTVITIVIGLCVAVFPVSYALGNNPASSVYDFLEEDVDWYDDSDSSDDCYDDGVIASYDSDIVDEEVGDRLCGIYYDVFGWYKGTLEDYDPSDMSPDNRWDEKPDFDALYMSSEYKKLLKMVKAADRRSGAEIGFFSYDHWVQGQDFGNLKMRLVGGERLNSNTHRASVDIYNYGVKHIEVMLVRENGEWMIDDFITSFGDDKISERAKMKTYLNR